MTTLISTLEGGKPAFFSMLWKRMGEQGDFPSLSKTVQHLAETLQEEEHNLTDVTTAILSDFALTQKVIRLANSAMYASIGGEITTVTRAAVVLGLDTISHLALGVRFVDTLSASSPDSATARTEMAKALVAGDVARNIAVKANLADSEEPVVCALMHHLGRLLLAFYFPEEWAAIQQLTASHSLTENRATAQVIGVTLDEISQETAHIWRLPKKISASMISSTQTATISIPGSTDWLKMLACFAGEAASILVKKGDYGAQLKALSDRYSDALLISSDTILASVNNAVATANDLILLESIEAPQGKPANAKARLAAGVQETARALAEGMSFGSALNLVLETIYAGMGFNRVAAFLRDGDSFRGKVGFGAAMPEALERMTFPETYAPDVFHVSLANKADVFIENSASKAAESSIPAWFAEALPDASAFVLLPMTFNGRAVGLLYGDWRQGTTDRVEKNELLLMRSLRDQLMQLLGQKKPDRNHQFLTVPLISSR
jgi:HD-like signal output (HDOD) protein